MKRVFFGMAVLSFSLMITCAAWAQVEPRERSVEPAVDLPPAVESIKKTALTPAEETLEKARAGLNGQEWMVYLTEAGGRRAATSTDVFTFKDGKVSSKNLVAQGYPESNFTLSLTGDGVPFWETMQVNEAVGLAFLRGELHGAVMKGAISMQPQKGAKSTLYFSTEKPSAAPAPVAQPKQTKKKGKK